MKLHYIPLANSAIFNTFFSIFACSTLPTRIEIHTKSPIQRSVSAFIQLDTKLSILETRIKVVDLLAIYCRGGKIGLFKGARVGKITIFVLNPQMPIFLSKI